MNDDCYIHGPGTFPQSDGCRCEACMSAVLYTCPVPGCEAVVTLEKAGIDDLLEELRERAHFPGRWSGRQCDELKELAERMNPPPICP